MAKQRSLTSGDNRIARLARWLQNVPAGEPWTDLRIETKQGGDWSQVQSYERARVVPDMANEIDALLCSVANECGEFLTARAVWYDPEGDKYFTAFPMRVHPDDMEGAQAFSGEGLNTFIQTQRHLETMARMHVGGFGSAIRALEVSNTQQAEINHDLREMNNELRGQVLELQEQLANALRELEAATDLLEQLEKDAPANEQQAQIIQLATHAMQNHFVASSAKK